MPLNDKTVFTDSRDIPLSTLREMCDEGDLITNPDYQRDYVYKKDQASKLVESILMGIPIPAVYLCEEPTGKLSVIDGQQRITSFVKYLGNEFELTGLREIPEYNGILFKNLDKTVQRKLKSSAIHAVVILKESQDLKYEIFSRLNQGSISLRPQELRNCIYRGSFNNLLNDLSMNSLLPKLFHDTNKRRAYQERILRFFTLLHYSEYKSSLKKTMNDYMFSHQNDDDEKIAEQKSLFTRTIDIVKQILGDKAFFGYGKENTDKLIEKFSGPVYDSIMIPFSKFEKKDLIQHADEIRQAIENLKHFNAEYRDWTYAATGTARRVKNRIEIVYQLILNIVGYADANDKRIFPEDIKKQLFHPGYICSYCHNEILSIDDAEIDHTLPYSLGGKTVIENAQLLHRVCNREKSNSIDSQYPEELDFEEEDDE